jgi:hypothetical protein
MRDVMLSFYLFIYYYYYYYYFFLINKAGKSNVIISLGLNHRNFHQ